MGDRLGDSGKPYSGIPRILGPLKPRQLYHINYPTLDSDRRTMGAYNNKKQELGNPEKPGLGSGDNPK